MFRGDNETLGYKYFFDDPHGVSYWYVDGSKFHITSGECYVYGNVMSLLYKDDYATSTTVQDYAFPMLFFDNPNIYNHPEKLIVLPATTLAESCYERMFYNCLNLTVAPELPATTLAPNCYYFMFENCTSLATAPELPATTLADCCYFSMFSRCTSLTTAPELPATTLVIGCYFEMFKNCYNLNYIKCLATDISAIGCTEDWLDGVSSTGTFVKHPSATWPTGNDGIPSGWTVVDAEL